MDAYPLVRIRKFLKTLLIVQFINVELFAGQGRTRVCGEAYFKSDRSRKPATIDRPA